MFCSIRLFSAMIQIYCLFSLLQIWRRNVDNILDKNLGCNDMEIKGHSVNVALKYH